MTAGQSYHFSANANVSGSDTLDAVAIRLYDDGGDPIQPQALDGAAPAFDFTPTTSGNYYLAVSAGGTGAWRTKTGAFTASMSLNGSAPGVDNIAQTRFTEATLSDGAFFTSAIEQNDLSGDTVDADYYKVVLTGGHRYTFSADATVSGTDNLDSVFIRLRDASGNKLTPDKLGEGASPSFSFDAPGSGNYVYYVAVSAGGSGFADKIGQYRVSFSDQGIPTPADQIPSTLQTTEGFSNTVLDSRSSTIDQFDVSGAAQDVDFFRVELTGGQSYTFSATAGVSSADSLDLLTLELLDLGGNLLSSDSGSNPTLVRPEYGSGTTLYFLSVRANGPNAADKVGQYQITLVDPPIEEPASVQEVLRVRVPFGSTAMHKGDRGAEVTQGYGDADPSHKNLLHYSIDFAVDQGTPILAQGPGTIVAVRDNVTNDTRGPSDLFGNFVTVEYELGDGTFVYATYMHLLEPAVPWAPVREGDSVSDGSFLGRVGMTGLTGGPHIHVTYGRVKVPLGTTSHWVADGSTAANPSGSPVYFTHPRAADGTFVVDSDEIQSDRGTTVVAGAVQEAPVSADGGLITFQGQPNAENGVRFSADGADVVSEQNGTQVGRYVGFFELLFGGGLLDDFVQIFSLQGTTIRDDTAFFEGNGGDDTLDATAAEKSVHASGGSGNDTLNAGTGSDVLLGGVGDDVLSGGAGNDALDGGLLTTIPVTMVGDALVSSGATSLLNTYTDVSPGVLSYYGPITVGGFTLTNITRDDFSFAAWDEDWATTRGYYYHGDHALSVPINGSSLENTIRIVRPDGGSFSAQSIDLNSIFGAIPAVVVTFSGVKADGNVMTQSLQLDLTEGYETLAFSSAFADLVQLDFTPSANAIFDNFKLTPTPSDDDIIDGGDGIDTVDYSTTALGVVVDLSASQHQGIGAEIGVDEIANIENVVGGDGNDVIGGTVSDNIMDGGPGSDLVTYSRSSTAVAVSLFLAGAQNTIGAGLDTLSNIEHLEGSAFADTLTGDNLSNALIGAAGADVLNGGGATDALYGGSGDDVFIVDRSDDLAIENANEGADTVLAPVTFTLGANVEYLVLQGVLSIGGYGNALSNWIYGNGAGNVVDGGAGADVLLGGAGDDSYYADNAGDRIVESAGEGVDAVYASVDFALGADVEWLFLQGGAAWGTGNDLGNVIIGTSAANQLNGVAGADAMYGGAGDDVYYVDSPDDRAIENQSAGADTVYSSAAAFILGDHLEYLVLYNGGIDGSGNAQDNWIYGNSLSNQLRGNGGLDRFVGRAGDDVYYVDSFNDAVFENAGEGSDSIYAALDAGGAYTIADHVEFLVLSGFFSISAFGNGANNFLYGNNAGNVLDGGSGNDSLLGLIGPDVIYGGAGSDTIQGGEGDDFLYGQAGRDNLFGETGADRFIFTSITESAVFDWDQIYDFSAGEGDLIDLSAIDANTATGGDQAFTFVSSFTAQAGQAVLTFGAGTNTTRLDLDQNGDGAADFQLVINGNVGTGAHWVL